MKKLIIVIICLILYHFSTGQNIGLRASSIFSKNNEMNTAFGGGLFFQSNDSLEKIGCYIYGDFLIKNKNFNNCIECPTKEVSTSYNNYSLGLSGYIITGITSKFKINIGPSIYYSITNAERTGINSNWIETYDIKSIGPGVLFNLHFNQLFKDSFNFDIFATPTYLVNIENKTNPSETNSNYTDNLLVFNLQMGISYKLR